MQPDQASFLLLSVSLPAVKSESQITKQVIGAIPLDKSEYRPDGISMTALDLAWHIVVTETRFIDSILAGQFDMSPRPRPDSVKNSEDVLSWYTENLAPRLKALTELSPEQLIKVIDFRGIMQLPAVLFLNLMMHHSVHHRGQLSMYLRPCGAKVPSIYGESYDAKEARKAKQAGA